jgi:Ohr subfamily peroxiredoxin
MTQLEKMLYTAKVHTAGGRDGAARSSDGSLDVQLSSPGTAGGGTNPEQLFAAGWSACFMSAMVLAAGQMKVALPADRAVDAEVDLGMTDGGYLLRARLNTSRGWSAKSPRPLLTPRTRSAGTPRRHVATSAS